MASLPPELIEQICSFLCFHCQYPGIISNTADTDDARLAKKALLHICRLSRHICAIAQPVLFHYYTSSNLPQEHHYGTRAGIQEISHNDKLPIFLRTIIQRPDLASHVKTLQLIETDDIGGCTPDLVSLFITATKDLGISRNFPARDFVEKKIWQGPEQSEALLRIQRRKVHRWFEELAILLLPNVEMLLMARDSFVQYEHIRDSGVSFPALKTLVLKSVSKNQHVHEAAALFSAAPNLETLYSTECCLFDGISPWTLSKPWTLNLKSVRKLILSDIGLEDLGLLVGCCPELQELNISSVKIHRSSGTDYWDISKLTHALNPARHKLRKMQLSHSSTKRLGADSRPAAAEISWSFIGFDQLEELTFGQAAIESHSWSTPVGEKFASDWSLIEVLPPSIRRIQFLHVNKGLVKMLMRLAREASFTLPNLKAVDISLGQDLDEGDFDWRCINSVTSAFESAGIEVRWDASQVGGSTPMLVPGRTAVFKLDQLSKLSLTLSKMSNFTI